MIDLHKILYATIDNWQTSERIRRDDFTFDAWAFIAERIGHKNVSTLRKMCEPRRITNGAKLGLVDAVIIMSITSDYRLFHFFKEELKRLQRSNENQLDLFAHPMRSLKDYTE